MILHCITWDRIDILERILRDPKKHKLVQLHTKKSLDETLCMPGDENTVQVLEVKDRSRGAQKLGNISGT